MAGWLECWVKRGTGEWLWKHLQAGEGGSRACVHSPGQLSCWQSRSQAWTGHRESRVTGWSRNSCLWVDTWAEGPSQQAAAPSVALEVPNSRSPHSSEAASSGVPRCSSWGAWPDGRASVVSPMWWDFACSSLHHGNGTGLAPSACTLRGAAETPLPLCGAVSRLG